MHEEINSLLNLMNASYHSVQKLLTYRLLSVNIKTKIYRNIILPVILYGRKTWGLTLRKKTQVGGLREKEAVRDIRAQDKGCYKGYRKPNCDLLHGLYSY